MLIYLQKDVCPSAQYTINIVESCRNNNETHQEISRKKMCHNLPKCNGETLVYHCVKHRKSWIQVCAPEGYITGNSNT